MEDNTYTEVRVGFFILLGIFIITIITLFVGDRSLTHKTGYTLYAEFDNVSGLDLNGPVTVAGVDIGHVTDIELAGERARVKMTIRKEVPIYRDGTAEMRTYGALGDMYVMITPGDPVTGELADGDTITNTISPVDLSEVLRNVEYIADEISGVAENINAVFGTEEAKEDMRATISNIREASENIRIMTAKVNAGEGTLGKLMTDESLYYDVKDSTRALKDVADKVEEGEGTIGRLVQDDSLYTEAENAMRELRKSAEGIQEQTPISVMATIFGLIF
ncbi:MAG: MCE family protein [Deltaproteobacteria bacterium]|nr:MCE family protein [Candidatus Zymogenaceae bacterium]